MGRITLFTEDNCEQSAIVKEHLNLYGIPFIEINLSELPGTTINRAFCNTRLSCPDSMF
jgi:hypothetical protein